MKEGLALVVAKSARAASEAIEAMRAIDRKSPVANERYRRAVQMAFSDPSCEFSQEEREVIAAGLTGEQVSKSTHLTLRLTMEEREAVEKAARAEGLTISDYVRGLIVPPEGI